MMERKIIAMIVGMTIGLSGYRFSPACAQTSPARPAAFNQCAACHRTEPGANTAVAPTLFGIGGKQAGQQAGFRYSPAMANSGLRWNRATLTDFVIAPRKVVPGTKMASAGIANPAKAQQVVDYLLSLK